jgi:hypothetical protein
MKITGAILYTLFHAKFFFEIIGYVANSAHNELIPALSIYGLFLLSSYFLVLDSILRRK